MFLILKCKINHDFFLTNMWFPNFPDLGKIPSFSRFFFVENVPNPIISCQFVQQFLYKLCKSSNKYPIFAKFCVKKTFNTADISVIYVTFGISGEQQKLFFSLDINNNEGVSELIRCQELSMLSLVSDSLLKGHNENGC